jgi:hypothetical protein
MQIIFFLIGIIGLGMFILGMKNLIKTHRHKTIGELKLTGTENEINFKKTGLYSVCVIGGGYANNLRNFEVKIINSGNELETTEKKPKFKFRYKGRLGTEFYHFKIKNLGIHKFIFKSIEDLEVKESMLLSKRFFQKKLPIENIGITVTETSSSWNYIISLLMAVFGFNIAGWGIILAFNHQIIFK